MAIELKEVTMSKKIVRADNWDGKSRPSNKAYDESWQRIFGKKEHEVEVSRLIQVFNNNIWENKKSVK